jgi:endo-1,4-beta-xylanase
MRKITVIKQMLSFFFISLFLFTTCAKHQALPPIPISDTTPSETGLKDINPNIAIGTAIEPLATDEKYLKITRLEFNTGQALWYAKSNWKGEYVYDFKDFNRMVNWMLDNKITPNAHVLTGFDLYMPNWLINRNYQPDKIDTLMRDMIYAIMDANDNKNKVAVWNVINELFEDDGSYRKNMVLSTIGLEDDASSLEGDDKINEQHPIFIRKAFEYCREKTDKKLELRDYDIESPDPSSWAAKKHLAFYQLVKHLLNTNVPLDAVGIQGHVRVGKLDWRVGKNGLGETVKKFRALGVEVHITEFDARIDEKKWTESLAEQQKMDYYTYIKEALDNGANQIHIWGIQDNYDKNWLFNQYPLPWDEFLNRKPAYYGIVKALEESNK